MVVGPLSTDSRPPRCQATSRAVLRVAVAVRPRKQWTPIWSCSVCEGASQLCLPAPPLYIALPAQAHLMTRNRAVKLWDHRERQWGLTRQESDQAAEREGVGPGPNHCLWGQHQHLHAWPPRPEEAHWSATAPSSTHCSTCLAWEATSHCRVESCCFWSSPENRPPLGQGQARELQVQEHSPLHGPGPFPKALPGWFYLTTTAGSSRPWEERPEPPGLDWRRTGDRSQWGCSYQAAPLVGGTGSKQLCPCAFGPLPTLDRVERA